VNTYKWVIVDNTIKYEHYYRQIKTKQKKQKNKCGQYYPGIQLTNIVELVVPVQYQNFVLILG